MSGSLNLITKLKCGVLHFLLVVLIEFYVLGLSKNVLPVSHFSCRESASHVINVVLKLKDKCS